MELVFDTPKHRNFGGKSYFVLRFSAVNTWINFASVTQPTMWMNKLGSKLGIVKISIPTMRISRSIHDQRQVLPNEHTHLLLLPPEHSTVYTVK